MGSQNSKYNELKKEINQIRDDYSEKLTENKIELANAYEKIDQLTSELDYYKNAKVNQYSVSSNQEKKNEIDLNNQRIDEMVDKIINDKSINCSLIPDVVERQIYKNVLTMSLELLKQTLENSKINFIGHEITFNVKPSEEKL